MASFRKAIMVYPPATQELFLKKMISFFTEKKESGVLAVELQKLAPPKEVVKKFAEEFGVSPPVNSLKSTLFFLLSLFLVLSTLSIIAGVGFYHLVLKPEIDNNHNFSFHFKLDEEDFFWGKLNSFEDSILVENVNTLVYSATKGEHKFTTVESGSLEYHCQYYGEDFQPEINKLQNNLVVNLDVDGFDKFKCSIKVPKKLQLSADIQHGSVVVQHPKNHININIANGRFLLYPAMDTSYNYNVSVLNGNIQDLPQGTDAVGAIKVNVKVQNGSIQFVEAEGE